MSTPVPPHPSSYPRSQRRGRGDYAAQDYAVQDYAAQAYSGEYSAQAYSGEYSAADYTDQTDYTGQADWAASNRTNRTTNGARRANRQRGLPGWAALLVLLVIAGLGGLIDTVTGSSARGGFNIAIVAASIVAVLLVRQRDLFPVVVAPPLVYIVGSTIMLYFRSGELHNRKILIDDAANLLVYGFPAVAGATAAVLIIGGIRLILGR